MAQQRTLIFAGALVVAVALALIGVLYIAGDGPLASGQHIKRALLFWALAAGAVVVANFNRPRFAA
jgi:hypothetical protein